MSLSRNFWMDSFLTLAVSASVILLNMLLAAALSRMLGQDGFGDYLFVRRFTAFLFPFTTLSLGVGLTRYVAAACNDPGRQAGFVVQSLRYILVINGLIIVGMMVSLFPGILGAIFPVNSGTPARLWVGTLFWLIAYSGFVMLYSDFRGRLKIISANTVNFLANGLGPVIIVAVLYAAGRMSLPAFLFGWAVVYGLCYLPEFRFGGNPFRNFSQSFPLFRAEVVTYSLPRIPAGLLLSAVPWFLPWFLRRGGEDAVFFLSALLVTQAVFYLSEPLSQIFLPGTSYWYREKQTEKISRLVSDTLTLSMVIGLVASSQLWIWSDLVVIRWFGENYAPTSGPVQILALAIVPAFLYAPLRSVLDGIENRAVITRILGAAVFGCLILTFALSLVSKFNTATACWIIVIYHFVVAVLLMISIYRRNRYSLSLSPVLEGIVLAAGLTGISIILHRIPWQDSLYLSIVAIGTAGLVCGITLFFWFRIRKPVRFDINY